MKKCFSALLALYMTVMFTGCMCESAETIINADGSGTVKATFGYSEQFVTTCDLEDEIRQEGFTRFILDGRIYYGDTVEETFADPAAFNAIFADGAAELKSGGTELNMGTLTLEQTSDGTLTLTFVCDTNTGSADAMARSLEANGNLSDFDLAVLRDELVMCYEFEFPQDVHQTGGSTGGVAVEGESLTLDLTQMRAGIYQFSTQQRSGKSYPAPEATNIPDSGIVRARTQNIDVDGASVTFKTYAIVDAKGGETNFVKLRDVAYAMNGTMVQFNVGWDGSVLIVPCSSYIANGSEMSTPFTGDRTYTKVSSATKVDGQNVLFGAINLTDDKGGGYTYYKLRDLGQVLGFNVGWNESRGIYIESDKPYTAE